MPRLLSEDLFDETVDGPDSRTRQYCHAVKAVDSIESLPLGSSHESQEFGLP